MPEAPPSRIDIRRTAMADIGEPQRYVEFEPIPTTAPVRVEPTPAPAPVPAEPEKVPA